MRRLGVTSAPFGMILDKNFELFVDLKREKMTIPWLIHSPGDIFPLSRIMRCNSDRVYTPNGVLTSVCGFRSVFLLPNIGCAKNHRNLQAEFKLNSLPPKSPYEHWFVFKEIINSFLIESEWRGCVLYFPKDWFDKLHNDKNWIQLKLYLHELASKRYEFEQNRIFYDLAFSFIQKRRGLKPNPYLTDTAKHLFETSTGAAPAYAPVFDNSGLPVETLQKIYIESYGLKKYLPTIIAPTHFNFENENHPIYYSLQNPSTHAFSPKARKILNTLNELRELEHIMNKFINELSIPNSICSDTVLGVIANELEFKYFHNERDKHNIISSTRKIPVFDERFNPIHYKHKSDTAIFASDAPFLRGCIGIKKIQK